MAATPDTPGWRAPKDGLMQQINSSACVALRLRLTVPADRHRAPSRRLRPLVPVGSAMILLLAAGCGNHRPNVAFPAPTTSSASSTKPPISPSASSPPTAKEAVIATYTAFLDAANRAISAPHDQAYQILKKYASGDFLDFQARQIGVHQAAHEEPWGKVIVHITSVDMAGRAATVHDCQDDSNAGLADQRTHQLIPRSRGTANQNVVADMALRGDGQWRVVGLKLYRASCQPS